MPYINLTYDNRPHDKIKRPLNMLEIMKLNPDAKVLTYPKLQDYSNIDELFSDTRKVIILYLLQSPTCGHWTTLFLNQDGINYFDSYGVMPDAELELLTPEKRAQLDQEQDYLNNHLLKDYKVLYNNITLQSKEAGTATCGCFVSHRLFYCSLDHIQYVSIFTNSKKSPDEVVSEWSFKRLGQI